MPLKAIDITSSPLEPIVELRRAYDESIAAHAHLVWAYKLLDEELHDNAFDRRGLFQPRFHPTHLTPLEQLVPLYESSFTAALAREMSI